MPSAAKSFDVGVGAFMQYLVFGPFPRLALVEQAVPYVFDTTNLTGGKLSVRMGFFSVPPTSPDEFSSGQDLIGPFDLGSPGNSFALPVGVKRQPLGLGLFCIEFVGNNSAGTFTAGAVVTTFPPRALVEVK
jgi:hypothetical protein